MSENEKVQGIFNEILWYYKYHFENWLPILCNIKSKRIAFLGGTGGQNNTSTRVIVKAFIIDTINTKGLLEILREEYFLACSKPNEYFVEIIDSIISKDKFVYFVLREEGINLKDFIESQNDYNKINPDYARFIIFRIGCGLKILHWKGLSHNDIKPGNIVLTGRGKAKICDMGSIYKIRQKKYRGTIGYFSPQVLLGKHNTKEDDMWSLGVVFLELITKRTYIFGVGTNLKIEDIGKILLQNILKEFFDISVHNRNQNKNINYQEIINMINDDEFDKFNYSLKPSKLAGINNEDKELIIKLLKINPAERLSADDLVNSDLFRRIDYKFIDSDFEYKEDDFQRYLCRKPANLEEFKQLHEEIKEKFIGQTIFNKNKN